MSSEMTRHLELITGTGRHPGCAIASLMASFAPEAVIPGDLCTSKRGKGHETR